jgi:hypothetical protein
MSTEKIYKVVGLCVLMVYLIERLVAYSKGRDKEKKKQRPCEFQQLALTSSVLHIVLVAVLMIVLIISLFR